MFSTKTFTTLTFAALVAAASCGAPPGKFNWTSCPFEEAFRETLNITIPFQCSNLTVPLDYLDTSSNETIDLQLSKIPATNGESQGSIFFNFGGPGLEARLNLVSQGEHLLALTGGKYDLIAFDPRGTANTSTFHCYNDTTRVITGLKQRLVDVNDAQDEAGLAYKWAQVQNYASDCLLSDESAPELAEVVGTGYVARDLIQMVDAADGEGALLNFYGLSYGSIVGPTFAALFPDRVGRIVADGIVNIPEYYHGFSRAWFKDADNALLDLFERCVDAGASMCPLASRNETAVQLNNRFYKTLEDLRTDPIPLGSAFVLDPSSLKVGLRIALYGPANYLPLTVLFDELFKPASKRNLTALAEVWLPLAEGADLSGVLTDDSASGILCGDKTLRVEQFSGVHPDLAREFDNISRSLGAMGNTLDYPCLVWPWHAKGAYEGSWHEEIETRNPLLFVGNTYDPVSPVSNGHNGSAIFKGSAVLEHQGVGHGSLAHVSLCTSKALRSYFVDGELPEGGTKCPTEFGAFEVGKTWKDALLPEMAWE